MVQSILKSVAGASGSIGAISDREMGSALIARSRARAALIPDLLVQAQRVANTVFSGWHGRKKRGVGENFWQFRPYTQGENFTAIDWRRSAREENQLYVRDNEWQASHTVWLWIDESPSMLFQSQNATTSKQARALVLAFAMAELLARSGERVGIIGVQPPISHRHAAERLANALMHSKPQTRLSNTNLVSDFSDVILLSDFLPKENEQDDISATIKRLSQSRVRGHLVQIIDPVEETFPYSGRVEFEDPENGAKIITGSAQSMKEDYAALFAAHTAEIKNLATRIGWTHTQHHTDSLASNALINLHLKMSEGAANFSGSSTMGGR